MVESLCIYIVLLLPEMCIISGRILIVHDTESRCPGMKLHVPCIFHYNLISNAAKGSSMITLLSQ